MNRYGRHLLSCVGAPLIIMLWSPVPVSASALWPQATTGEKATTSLCRLMNIGTTHSRGWRCADVVWTFLGLSIPEQTLILFTVLVIANLWQVVRRNPTGS